MLRKYQGARISVSGGTDISGASSGGAAEAPAAEAEEAAAASTV